MIRTALVSLIRTALLDVRTANVDLIRAAIVESNQHCTTKSDRSALVGDRTVLVDLTGFH
jgi:hypothetical protein